MGSKSPDPGGAVDGEDIISSLPDDVLLRILSFVPTTEEAIRTRALSRRWRHVWLCRPALAFSDIGKTPTTPGLVELVDAALAHSHDSLAIHIQHPRHKLCANAWLQQAAEGVHGKISLKLDDYSPITVEDLQWHWRGFGKVVLDLPCNGGARTAAMSFSSSLDDDKISTLRLPAVPAVNNSLTVLELDSIRVDGGRLSDFVSSCGQLRRLLMHFVRVVDCPVFRISNKVLEELDVDYILGGDLVLGGLEERLEVSCPKLRLLRVHRLFVSPDYKSVGRFCIPCLEEIYWPVSALVPKKRVEFLGSMDTVRRLNVGLQTQAQTYESHLGAWLLRSCTGGVHRLDVSLWNTTKDVDVVNLMEELPKLSSVTHLRVTTRNWMHMFRASIAELLSRCCQLQRLDVCANNFSISDTCPPECLCKRPLEWWDRKLSLDFLEHVEIYYNNHRVDWIDDLNTHYVTF